MRGETYRMTKEIKKTDPKVWSEHYDEKYDIYSVHWGGGATEVSEEITTHEGHKFVIDYSRDGKIVGIEIFDWSEGGKKK